MSHLCSLPLLLIFPTVWDLQMNRFDVGGHPCHAPNLGEHVQYFIIGKVLVTQSYLTLCDPMDCSPPCSSVPGILQARILEWVVIPFSRDRTQVSHIAGRYFTLWATWEAQYFTIFTWKWFVDNFDQIKEAPFLIWLSFGYRHLKKNQTSWLY